MMDFHPSKGYSWKTSADTTNKKASSTATTAEKSPSTAKSSTTNTATVANTTKSVLRAQETHVFRHWMDRAIESASIRVTQARQAIDTPELETKATGASSSSNNIDSPSSQLRGTYKKIMQEDVYTNLIS